MITPRQQRIFEFITDEVFASSGDGSGTIILKGAATVTSMADAFDEWQLTHATLSKWPLARVNDSPTSVTFYRDQEGFTIRVGDATKDDVIHCFDDVTLCVWDFPGYE